MSVSDLIPFTQYSRGFAMSDVKCPHCGGTNESNAAFCGSCGTPMAVQPPAAPANQPPPQGWQPPAPGQLPPGAIPAPPGAYPPAGGYAAPPPGAIPAPPGV